MSDSEPPSLPPSLPSSDESDVVVDGNSKVSKDSVLIVEETTDEVKENKGDDDANETADKAEGNECDANETTDNVDTIHENENDKNVNKLEKTDDGSNNELAQADELNFSKLQPREC